MTESHNEESSSGLSRRDALKTGGLAAAGMTAMLAAFGADAAGASSTGATMTAADFLNFQKLVTKCWASPAVLKAYEQNPTAVLKEYSVTIPAGIPTPTIPPKPKGSFGTATTESKAWETAYTADLPSWVAEMTSVSAGSTLSLKGTFGCFACPISTFCCLTA